MRIKLNKAFRFFKKNKAYSIINISGLAFGFACALLILMHAFKEYSYNSSIPENGRVFHLLQKNKESDFGNTFISYALPPILAEEFPEVESYARTENFSQFSNCVVSYENEREKDKVSFNESQFYLADPDLFDIIQYPFIEGNKENALQEVNSIVLSKKTAQKYFGDSPALGKTLVVNKQQVFKVTGVVDFPKYVTFHFSLLAPLKSMRSDSKLEGWDSNGEPYFKLKEGVDYMAFNKKIKHFYSDLKPSEMRDPEQSTLSLLPITDRQLYYNNTPLTLLIFIGLIILTVSILNYVNMSTSIVRDRVSEIALKKISGAGNKQIGIQFMKETAYLAFVAIVLGSALVLLLIPFFRQLTGSDILYFLQTHKGLFLRCCIILFVSVTFLSGFYPAIILSGVQPLSLLGKSGKGFVFTKRKNVFVTIQFFISIVLISITLMTNRQFRYLATMPMGFNDEFVIQVPLSNTMKNKYLSLKEELVKIPTVKNICASSSMPAGIPNHSGVTWKDEQGMEKNASFAFAITSGGYTQAFDMSMAMGKAFDDDDPSGLKGVIVNETAAEILGFKNPVGKSVHFWGKQNTIIGVVKDFQNNYTLNPLKPMIISAHPENRHFAKYLFISMVPGNTDQTVSDVESTITSMIPGFPFEYRFVNDEVNSYINEVKQIGNAFKYAGIISILLAVIGIVALAYHATQLRTKEIGIRKVNGARGIEITAMLNSMFLKDVIIAFILACPVGWVIINELLSGLANKTTISWWVFALSGLIAFGITLFTVSWQSWRAARRNPVEALRYE